MRYIEKQFKQHKLKNLSDSSFDIKQVNENYDFTKVGWWLKRTNFRRQVSNINLTLRYIR